MVLVLLNAVIMIDDLSVMVFGIVHKQIAKRCTLSYGKYKPAQAIILLNDDVKKNQLSKMFGLFCLIILSKCLKLILMENMRQLMSQATLQVASPVASHSCTVEYN